MVMHASNTHQDDNLIHTIKEGYMFVQANAVWKPWSMKAKYFILTSECLYCFKRRGDLDAIPSDVIRLDNASVTINDERRGMRKRYYIRITSSQQRKMFNIFCFAVEERNAWLTCILSALAKKFTDRGFQHKAKGCKSVSLADDNDTYTLMSRRLEEIRPMSISCMELTNMSVMPEPFSPIQTAIPIRKTFDFSHIYQNHKKMSSGSLDIAVRTDINCSSPQPDISLNTREYYGTVNRLASKTLEKTRNNLRNLSMGQKRPKSMSDLLAIDDLSDEPGSYQSTPSEKRKRKTKRLSFAALGNNLNFRTSSMANLF